MKPTARPAAHNALLYANEDASLEYAARFITDCARANQRVLILSTKARWEDIAARLSTAGIDSVEAVRRRTFVVADAATVADQVAVDGFFDRERFDMVFQALVSQGPLPQGVYGEAASILVERCNLPAALALEQAWQELGDARGMRICCGYNLKQFLGPEHDWQVRSILNAHEDTLIAGDIRVVPAALARRFAKDAELILLWDDYADTRTMYAEALTLSGYRVITAADAQQALKLATAYRPHLVLLDVRLPAPAAVITVQMLRAADDFKAPILAITAHAFETERENILEVGFDRVLSKPCLPDELVNAVAQALDGDEARNGSAS